MTARAHTVALSGVTGHLVQVEADVTNGPTAMILAGLGQTGLREARDRVRAAVVNSGEPWPQRCITVTLSPVSMPKPGAGCDLAIAVAVLTAAGHGLGTVVVAAADAAQAALVPGIRVIAADSLTAVLGWLRGIPVPDGEAGATELDGGQATAVGTNDDCGRGRRPDARDRAIPDPGPARRVACR